MSALNDTIAGLRVMSLQPGPVARGAEGMMAMGDYGRAVAVRSGSARSGDSFADVRVTQTASSGSLHNRVSKLRRAMLESTYWYEFGVDALEKTVERFETTTLNINPLDPVMADFLPSVFLGIDAVRASHKGLPDTDLVLPGSDGRVNLAEQFEVIPSSDPANEYSVDRSRGKLPGMISVIISSEKRVLDLNVSQYKDSFVVRGRGTNRVLGIRTFAVPEEAGRPAIEDFSVAIDSDRKSQPTWLSFIQFKGRVGHSASGADDELGLPLDRDGNFMLDSATPVWETTAREGRMAMKCYAFISYSKIVVLFTFVQTKPGAKHRLAWVTTLDGNYLHQAFGRVVWMMKNRLDENPVIQAQRETFESDLKTMRSSVQEADAGFRASQGFFDTIKALATRAKRSLGVAGTQRAIDTITEARSLHHYKTLVNYLQEAADLYPAARDYARIVDNIAQSTSRTKAIPENWKAVNSISLLQITGSKFDNIFKELWTRKGMGEPIVRILAPTGSDASGETDLSRYRILVIDADAHPVIYGEDFYRTIKTEAGNSAKTFDQQSRRSVFLHLEQNSAQESQTRQLAGAPKSISVQIDTADEDTREALESIPETGTYLGDYIITNAGRDPSGASNPFVVLIQFLPDTRRFGRMGRVYFIYQKEK